MMKNIVHVAYNHSFDDTRIMHKECVTLQKSGLYNVTYITSSKNSQGSGSEYNNIKIHILEVQGKNRIVRVLKYNRLLKKILLKYDADIYHFHEITLMPVMLYLKRKNKKTIYDMHESNVEDLENTLKRKLGAIVARAICFFVKIYEEKGINKSDGFIYVTPQFERKNCAAKSLLLPNFPIIDNDVGFISQNDFSYKGKELCFAGNISDLWNIRRIIELLPDIEDVRFNLAGRATAEYENEIRSLPGWTKVNYYGLLPFSDVKKIYDKSRIGMAIVRLTSESDYKGTLGNNKIYEFMQAGLPVICSRTAIWKEMIEKYNCGICVDPSDTLEITEAINYLLNNEATAFEMGQNSLKAIAQEYNWNILGEKLLDFYNELLTEVKYG